MKMKLPPDKRYELAQVYLNMGLQASGELAIEYRVSYKYGQREARERYGVTSAHFRKKKYDYA